MADDFFSDSEIKGLKKVALEELRELYESILIIFSSLDSRKNGKFDLKGIADLYHTVTGTAGIAGMDEISELASEAGSMADSKDMETEAAISELDATTKRFGTLLLQQEQENSDNASR